MMKNLDIKAIVLATLAVYGIDFVSGVTLFGMFTDLPDGASQQQVKDAALALAKNSDYLRVALILGTASTVVGGFLIARIARTIPYFNALAYAVLGIAISTLGTGVLPTWFRVVGIALTVPAALLGAYFGRRPLSK
jgi:hypothetical protein